LKKNWLEFNYEEEGYIDDIPFETECVTLECLYHEAVSVDFEHEEEEYIDDIPFDTKCVSAHCLYAKAMKVEFNF